MTGHFEKGAWVADPPQPVVYPVVPLPEKQGVEFMQVGFFVSPDPKGTDMQIITLEPRRFADDSEALREFASKVVNTFVPVGESRSYEERAALRIELKKFMAGVM